MSSWPYVTDNQITSRVPSSPFSVWGPSVCFDDARSCDLYATVAHKRETSDSASVGFVPWRHRLVSMWSYVLNYFDSTKDWEILTDQNTEAVYTSEHISCLYIRTQKLSADQNTEAAYRSEHSWSWRQILTFCFDWAHFVAVLFQQFNNVLFRW